MHQPPTGTVTFLFTDIEGSTKLWQDHPDAMRSALARHDQLLRQTVTENGGYVFKTVGDAFCAAFATAPEALAAALSAQQSLVIEPWPTETPLRVRMALHTGSAEERDGDYFGPPLNRVARLMAAGHGGQTLLSLAAQELTRDHLPEAMTLLDLGERCLKDLGRPEHVFQAVHPSLATDFPPLKSLDNPDLPNNLPQEVTTFIGREKQIEEVTGLLGKTRLLTLTGTGGSGKTRLSLQVAADLLDQYFDGVWLVELAALSDPSLVPQAVAAALGLREEPGKPIQRTFVEVLKAKRLLLILDNCEHLVAACASLAADLLRSCPDVRILASSRESLNVSGEQTFRVPSLSLPDPSKIETVESLSQYEAVRLFIERAQAVQPTFALTDANAPAVAQMCFHLDGIPLAIELAAARVRSLPVEEVNRRLSQRFRLLTGGSRTALPRQQTLQALMDWSYDLLTEQEKALLCRLSVFAGGWTLSAAETVCADEGVEDWEVLDLLASLVDKSLVVYEEGEGGVARYRLLETVKQYAADRLVESGEASALGERHTAWALALAEEAEPQLSGPEQGAWLSRLEAEHDNLRSARGWYEQATEQRAQEGLRLAGALWRFWSVRGHFTEGRQWLNKALEKTKHWEASGERANALNAAGNLAYGQSDYAAARSLHEESLTLRRRLSDPRGIAASLGNLGLVASEQGDYETARALFEESLTLFRYLEDQRGIANALGNIGDVALGLGDYRTARTLQEESLTLRRQLGDEQGIAYSLHSLGNVALGLGDYGTAQTLFEESLALRRRLSDPRGVAASLGNLGLVAFRQGDYRAARASQDESLTIQRRLGDWQGITNSLEVMAGLAHGKNQLSRAMILMGASFSLRGSIGSPLPSSEQHNFDRQVAAISQMLGDEAFAAAWDAGRAMTLDEAVEYALSDLE